MPVEKNLSGRQGRRRPAPGRRHPPAGRPGRISAFRCDFETSLSEVDHGGLYLAAYEGELHAFLDEDREHPAGRARLFVLNADAAREAGVSLFDLLDQRPETAHFMPLLGDAEGELAPSLSEIAGPRTTCNMLLLEHLEILPAFLGQELGLLYVRAAVTRFGLGCKLVAARIPPVVSPRKTAPGQRTAAKPRQTRTDRAAILDLKMCYSLAGFVKMPGSDLMILDLVKHRAGR